MAKLKDILDNINNKNFDQALKLCDLCEDNNNKHIIYNLKGVINLMQNNLESAETNFLNSIKIDQKFIDPIKNLYILYLKKQKFSELLTYAKKLIEIDKLNDTFNYQLGYAFELNNLFNQAIDYYEKYLNLNGKDKKKALNNIGSIYLKKNKLEKSKSFFLKALDLDQNDKVLSDSNTNHF